MERIMSRITQVVLDGFKGQSTSYELGERTILAGPNGLGKSAVLEGVVFALSGAVPSGRSPDEVAKYFGDQGGAVTLIDDDGRWIERRITRDWRRGSGKVSEEVTTSDTKEGEPAESDLEAWQAAPDILDLREFLGLSPQKRREHLLALCGRGGEADLQSILACVADAYARELAGPMARGANMGQVDDFPAEVQPLVEEWGAPRRGILSRLGVQAARNLDDATALWSELVRWCGEEKSASRRAKDEAVAASAELELAARDAEPRAQLGHQSAIDVAAAEERMARARERQGATKALREARGRLEAELRRLPPAPATSREFAPEDGERLSRDLEAMRDAQIRRRNAEASLRLARGAIEEFERYVREARERLGRLDDTSAGRAVCLMAQIPDTAHPQIPELRAAIEEIAAGWRSEIAECQNVLQLRTASLEKKQAEAAKIRDELQALPIFPPEEIPRAEEALAEFGRWRVHETRRKLQAQHADLTAHIAEIGEDPGREYAEAEQALYEAQRAQKAAQEAAGRLQALAEARDRAKAQEVRHEAYKRLERALKAAREVYVQQTVSPVLDDLNAVLEEAGRTERAYLDLENARGTPIFDIGWTRGGTRIPIQALSGGEAVIFAVALSLTLARGAPGRKVLLVEGDPMDNMNLAALVAALERLDVSWLDACLVATARPLPESFSRGWTTVRFEGRSLATQTVKRSRHGRTTPRGPAHLPLTGPPEASSGRSVHLDRAVRLLRSGWPDQGRSTLPQEPDHPQYARHGSTMGALYRLLYGTFNAR